MRCDQYNIPVATNIATAELLILGLARGDLDWRLNLKMRVIAGTASRLPLKTRAGHRIHGRPRTV